MKNTIVMFHIGKGGRFNNGGHLTYKGVHELSEVESYFGKHLFIHEDDKTLNEVYDSSGDEVCTMDEYNSGIGTINFDNEYDTYYTKTIKDCTEKELALIVAENPYDLENLIKEATGEDFNLIKKLKEKGFLSEAVLNGMYDLKYYEKNAND